MCVKNVLFKDLVSYPNCIKGFKVPFIEMEAFTVLDPAVFV